VAILDRRRFLRSAAWASAGACFLSRRASSASSLEPADAGTASDNNVFPKSSPPAKTLWALRFNELDVVGYDEPRQDLQDEKLPLTTLQGLVNRQQPQIFLLFDRFDELWLEWLRERGDVQEIRWVGTEQLYERFLPAVKGLVVTDPDLPGSVNIATMLAGIQGWLPVTPRLLPLFDLPIAMDLRGRWKKNIDAYRWFYSNYAGQMSDRVCACLDPGVFELRDYIAEFRVPLVWVSGPQDAERSKAASPAEEEQFARELFLKLPPNIPCLGWWDHGQAGEEGIGEGDGVTLASQCGKFQVCSGWDGLCRAFSNLSVHSGTSATFQQKVYPPPPLDKKVYFTYTRTDGDGPNFWRQAYRKLWSDPDHGKVPVGWQLGPTAYDLIPDVLDYFYRHATSGDVFVNALTGVGYIREEHYAEKLPESQQASVWDRYMELSNRYFKLFDLSLLTTHQEMPPELLERFAGLPGIQGIFANYHRSDETTLENETSEVKGVPVFRAIARGGAPLDTAVGRQRAVGKIVADIRRFTPSRRPAFLEVSLTNWAVDMKPLVEIGNTLGPEYVLVRPDQLAGLYKIAKGSR
jgi:hypothetical protein